VISVKAQTVWGWLGATAVVVGIATVLALLVGLAERSATEEPRAAALTPTPVLTPTPAATEDFGPPPTIVIVDGDLVANPPTDGRSIGQVGHNGGEIIQATGLGERYGYYFTGTVGSENRVCLNIYSVDGETGSGVCDSYAHFQESGLMFDHGSWQIRWWADGRVDWVED
jgi:hypothetical protein